MSNSNISLPKFTEEVIGHTQILKELVGLYNNNKMHHAYIFNGIKGIGKASLVYFLTKLILTSNNNKIESLTLNNNNEINLILNNIHPNLLVVEPIWNTLTEKQDASISVEQTRTIKDFLNSTSLPYKDKTKIVIIDALDNLNVNAANSILKTLEEPKDNKLFLLICHNIQNILPTIKSRCIIKNFQPLRQFEINKIIDKLNIELPKIALDVKIQEGSIQEVLWFLDSKNLNAYNLAKSIITNKDISQINLLYDTVKDLSVYNFKYLIELLLIDNANFSNKLQISSKSLQIKQLLDQNQTFNLDKSALITFFMLDLIS